MPHRWLLLGLVLLGGCHGWAQPVPVIDRGVAADPGQYAIVGEVPQAGRYVLRGQETVSSVLRPILPALGRGPTTIILVRRGPEGATRELIDLDSKHRPVNANQDYPLRGGDELILQEPAVVPVGLQRPPAQTAARHY